MAPAPEASSRDPLATAGGSRRPLAVVTGATSGIGREAARALARAGHDLVLVARSPERAGSTAAELAALAPAADLVLVTADLSSTAEVARAAAQIVALSRPVRLLLNDAGAIFATRQRSAEGVERTFALNHLAYFQLTLRLLPRLREAAPARVVNVASDAFSYAGGRFAFAELEERSRYRPLRRYGASKLANILFTSALSRRLAGSGVDAVAWTPRGLTATRFAYETHWLAPVVMRLLRPFAVKVEDAVPDLIALCTGALPSAWRGRLIRDGRPVQVPACNEADAERLWTLSAALTGVGAGGEEAWAGSRG